ncbi:hypothetical protein V6N11_034109 [Hibiscus sabdariffa]|uniref:Uncharacterized protein n=1 Tax=Hibiscus sabdariffa TaxID=183260 RepID=A0ABR2S1W6_9ROSI
MGPSGPGANINMDSFMVNDEEDVPIDQIEGVKHPRNQAHSPIFSPITDLNDAIQFTSADLQDQPRARVWHFRFESSWLMEESCEDTVKSLWAKSEGDYLTRLQFTCRGMDVWFQNVRWAKRLSTKDFKKSWNV